MEIINNWFGQQPLIIKLSLLFYLIIIALYFLVLGWQQVHTKGCPVYEPFEANFLTPECEEKYQLVFQVESLWLQGSLLGYLSLFVWSFIRGILQLKKERFIGFLPLLLNLVVGLGCLFTVQIWLFNLIF